MATNFPGSLDTSTQQPTIASSDEMDDSGKEHDVVHTNHSGAIIALETKLGSTDSNPSSGAVLMGTGSGTSAWDATPTFTGDVTIPDGDLILGSTAVTSTAAELNILDGSGTSWTEGTPSWTNLDPGNATANTIRHIVIGKVCVAQFKITHGSSTNVTGTVSLAPPVNADYSHWQMAGNAWFHDTSGGKLYQGQCVITSSTKVSFYGIYHGVGTYSYSGGLGATNIATWNTGDSFTGQIVYRVA